MCDIQDWLHTLQSLVQREHGGSLVQKHENLQGSDSGPLNQVPGVVWLHSLHALAVSLSFCIKYLAIYL